VLSSGGKVLLSNLPIVLSQLGAGCQACSVAIRGDVSNHHGKFHAPTYVETNLDAAGLAARATLLDGPLRNERGS
jgi:hypothetical protein